MYKRKNRVSKLIYIEVSNMLLFGELKDPRIRGSKITAVEVSEDLSNAKVFFEVEDKGSFKEALDGFKNASGYIRKRLGEVLYMKKIPKLFFIHDNSEENFNRIEEIIKKIHNE